MHKSINAILNLFFESCLPNDLILGSWSKWAEWQPCSATCGQGTQFRTRICLNNNRPGSIYCPGQAMQTRPCNLRHYTASTCIKARYLFETISIT